MKRIFHHLVSFFEVFHDTTRFTILAMAGFTMCCERFSVAQSGLGSLDLIVLEGVVDPLLFPYGFLKVP